MKSKIWIVFMVLLFAVVLMYVGMKPGPQQEVSQSYKIGSCGCNGIFSFNETVWVCNDCPGKYDCIKTDLTISEAETIVEGCNPQ